MGFLGAVVGAVVGTIESFISTIKEVTVILQAVVNVLTSICRDLGILPPEMQEEELGDRAIQAEEAGIKLEDFDTYQEYVKAIQDFEIDPEKSDGILLEEKLAKAAEVEAKILASEKPEIALTACLGLIAGHMGYFTPEKVEAIGEMFLKAIKAGNLVEASNLVENIANVVDKNDLNPEHKKLANLTLVNLEKQIDPGISDVEALNRAKGIY